MSAPDLGHWDVPPTWGEPVERQGERAGLAGARAQANPCSEGGIFYERWETGRKRGAKALAEGTKKNGRRWPR